MCNRIDVCIALSATVSFNHTKKLTGVSMDAHSLLFKHLLSRLSHA